MNELFVLIVFHCSGGHGDTFSLKGVFFHFATALHVAKNIEKENIRMDNSDHGAFICRVGLNKVYGVRESDNIMYSRRFHIDGPWIEEWHDEKLRRIHEK